MVAFGGQCVLEKNRVPFYYRGLSDGPAISVCVFLGHMI